MPRHKWLYTYVSEMKMACLFYLILTTQKKCHSNIFLFQHFVSQSGPTEEFPDPLPADQYSSSKTPKSARKQPVKRRRLDSEYLRYSAFISLDGSVLENL